MNHNHFHHHYHQRRQFGSLDDPLSQLADGINSFFGVGGNGNNHKTGNDAPSARATLETRAPNPSPAPEAAPNAVTQSIVYVTASNTFTGQVSYSTIIPTAASTTAPSMTFKEPVPVSSASSTASDDDNDSSTTAAATETSSSILRTTAVSSQKTSAAATAAASTTLASSILSSGSSSISATAAAASSTSTDASSSGADTGLSGGAKAGIAFGVILGILALAAAAYALYRMKKRKEADELASMNEKNPFTDSAAAPAPMKATAAPSTAYSQSAAPTNPFGAGAVPVSTASGNPAVSTMAGMAAAATVGAAAASARRTSIPPPLNLNRAQSPALVPPPGLAPSPSGSNFSESSTMSAGDLAALGGAGAGAAGGPRMHRVQMDFNPTMEDELQIRAGEIVRIVRDFDDGWCSVEIVQRDGKGNVTRHQQGVVPRTCLSRLPLKPRQKRPGPTTAAGPSPLVGSGSPRDIMAPAIMPQASAVPRSQSPAFVAKPTQRSMSPGPYGGGPQDRPQQNQTTRSRSNSANDVGARPRNAPLGPSPMNPAAQTPKSIELPIQIQSPLPGQTPEGFVSAHGRTTSGGSSASSQVTRKPVPKKTA